MRGTAVKVLGAFFAVSGSLAWLTGPGQALTSAPQATLTAGGAGVGDNFGFSVAMDGDTAVVGVAADDTPAGANAGSVRVFQRSGDHWTEQAVLAAGDAAPDDRFGWAVAVSGDVAVVGVPFDDTAAGSNAGSVRVFVRSGTNWSEEATLTAADAAEGDVFGFSVALARTTALVGVVGDDTAAGSGTGSARVFERAATTNTWAEQAMLSATDADPGDNLGFSVALDGDTAVVGAVGDDTPGAEDAGSAQVFQRSGNVWATEAILTAGDGASDDLFGYSVAIDGDSVAVGVVGDDAAGGNAGSARVFTRSAGAWAEQAALTSTHAASAGDNLGYSVAVHRNTVLAGAIGDDTAGADAGAALVYVRSENGWTEQATITATDAAFGDNLGQSVSPAAHLTLVGNPRDNTEAGGDAGSATLVSLDQPPVAVADAYSSNGGPLVVGDPLHVVREGPEPPMSAETLPATGSPSLAPLGRAACALAICGLVIRRAAGRRRRREEQLPPAGKPRLNQSW